MGTMWCRCDPTPSGESLSEAWTRFKDLLQKVPHHGIDLWLQVKIFYDHVNPATRRTIDQSAGDGTKSYPVGIIKNVEVHIGKVKLLEDFYVIDMEKDPETPLLVGRGFLVTASAVIDCKKAKIAPYTPRPSTDDIGAWPPYYAKKDFMDYHLPKDWEMARDAELNPFEDDLVFRKMCITRSSTKELLLPFDNPEQIFHSRRRLFDTPSLIESNSPEFDHNFDIEEQSEEEGRETMTETMEQYMSKTRGDYGGSEHEDANVHIEKVLEIVDLFHIPKITQDQIMLRAFPVFLTGAASRWLRNQPSGSITTWEVLKTKFLNKYCPPTRTVKKMKEINNFQQEPDESLFRAWERFKELLMKSCKKEGLEACPALRRQTLDQVKSVSTAKADFSKIHRIRCGPYAVLGIQHKSILSETVPFPRRLQNFGYDDWREAQDVKILDAYDHTLPQKEKDPGSFTLPCFIHNICFDKALVGLGASVSVMPFSTYTNLGLGILSHTRLTIELADRTIKQPRGIAKNALVRIGKFIFPIDFIILDIPEDDDVPLILERPLLSTAHSKIDVFKRKITLRVGEEKLIFKSIKLATSIIKRVFMIKSLDSKTKLLGEGDESFDPTYVIMDGCWVLGEDCKKARILKLNEEILEDFIMTSYRPYPIKEGYGVYVTNVHQDHKGSRINTRLEKSDYGNPLNTATDSFFKAHDEHDIEEGNELRQMKRKEDNKNDEHPK
ncbi:hypothetical protein Tco_0859897 [Tanacetum coccineum]|uniref:Retrotransposon gag domain-containing protein n=1 Tax=Tanacetum coccineum TaxID=301880 RepID=A0ABQ5BDC4_9ASTR